MSIVVISAPIRLPRNQHGHIYWYKDDRSSIIVQTERWRAKLVVPRLDGVKSLELQRLQSKMAAIRKRHVQNQDQ